MIQRHTNAQTKRSLPPSTNRDAYKSSYESSRLVYDLRKQVLDKLDLILQKVNLSVLKCLDSGTKSIKLISMTQLEEEIEDLFAKLDECIANREKSFRMYDNDMVIQNHQLIKENEQLKRINLQLIERLQEEQEERDTTPLSKISALQREVENLNSQINRYENWRQTNSVVEEEKFLTHNKLLIQLHKILKQSGRLRLLALGVKKVFKQYSQSFSMMKNDFGEKLTAMTGKWSQSVRNALVENEMLKQQIGSWQSQVQGVLNRFREKE